MDEIIYVRLDIEKRRIFSCFTQNSCHFFILLNSILFYCINSQLIKRIPFLSINTVYVRISVD